MRVHTFPMRWKQGPHRAPAIRSYIYVRRKTWASKVGSGRAGLWNGGRITSAITKAQRLTGVWEAGEGVRVEW